MYYAAHVFVNMIYPRDANPLLLFNDTRDRVK